MDQEDIGTSKPKVMDEVLGKTGAKSKGKKVDPKLSKDDGK